MVDKSAFANRKTQYSGFAPDLKPILRSSDLSCCIEIEASADQIKENHGIKEPSEPGDNTSADRFRPESVGPIFSLYRFC